MMYGKEASKEAAEFFYNIKLYMEHQVQAKTNFYDFPESRKCKLLLSANHNF